MNRSNRPLGLITVGLIIVPRGNYPPVENDGASVEETAGENHGSVCEVILVILGLERPNSPEVDVYVHDEVVAAKMEPM